MGQVYVLFSRVTDPNHLQLIGRVCVCVSVCACLLVIYAHVYVLCEALQAYRRRTSSKKFVVPGSVKGLIGSTAFGGRPPSQMNGSTLRQRKGASATD